MSKLLAQPDKLTDEGFRDHAILLTLIDTGIRLPELAGMKVPDIDYDQNLIRVMGKGSRERYAPSGRPVAKTMMKYQMKHRPEALGTDHFWLRHDGQSLTSQRVQRIETSFGDKAGLNRCYPHKLRHSSLVMYLRNGGDVFSLQKKLGHRSLSITRRYSNLAYRDVRDRHLKYGVADHLRI